MIPPCSRLSVWLAYEVSGMMAKRWLFVVEWSSTENDVFIQLKEYSITTV